jgi:hypothetical protein
MSQQTASVLRNWHPASAPGISFEEVREKTGAAILPPE